MVAQGGMATLYFLFSCFRFLFPNALECALTRPNRNPLEVQDVRLQPSTLRPPELRPAPSVLLHPPLRSARIAEYACQVQAKHWETKPLPAVSKKASGQAAPAKALTGTRQAVDPRVGM